MFIGIGMNNSQLDSIEFDVNGSARVGIHLAATNPINTALGTAVPPGTATVAPRSMTNITSGTVLNVGRGTNMEPVYVTASTGSTFTATFAKSHSANDPVGGSAGSSGVELRDVSVLNVPSARTTFDQSALKSSAAILIGNQTSGGTPQVSEVSFSRLDLAGNNGSAGIAFITGGNIKNFLLSDVVMGGFHYGIDIVTGGSGTYSIFRPVFANTTVADVRANGATVFISGAEAEGTTGHRFLVGSIGDNPYATTIIGSSWESSAPSDDYVVAYSGSLTLIGNKFFNLRTSSSLPKLQIGDPLFTAHAPSILFSVGNYYMNAPSGYAPIYDGSNNQALPTYYSSQPVNVTSLGDYGGTGGALVHLYNYLSTSALTSQSASAVARSGLVRAGDTDTAVAFRDHRNHADVQGLAKDTSDVVFVGGTAGIGLNSPVQIGNAPNENIKAPAKGTGMGPKTPGTVVGWVPVKVGDSTYFMPLMK